MFLTDQPMDFEDWVDACPEEWTLHINTESWEWTTGVTELLHPEEWVVTKIPSYWTRKDVETMVKGMETVKKTEIQAVEEVAIYVWPDASWVYKDEYCSFDDAWRGDDFFEMAVDDLTDEEIDEIVLRA